MLLRPHLFASAIALSRALGAAQNTTIKVVQLSVDGRFDQPLDLQNPHPTLAWQIIDTGNCTRAVCPGERHSKSKLPHHLRTCKPTSYYGKLGDVITSLNRFDLKVISPLAMRFSGVRESGMPMTSSPLGQMSRSGLWAFLTKPTGARLAG